MKKNAIKWQPIASAPRNKPVFATFSHGGAWYMDYVSFKGGWWESTIFGCVCPTLWLNFGSGSKSMGHFNES